MRGLFSKWWIRPPQTDAHTVHPDEVIDTAVSAPTGSDQGIEDSNGTGETEIEMFARVDQHPDLQFFDFPPSTPKPVTAKAPVDGKAALKNEKPHQLTIEFEEGLFAPRHAQKIHLATDEELPRAVEATEVELSQPDDDEMLLDEDFDDENEVDAYHIFGSEPAGHDELENPFDREIEQQFKINDDALLDTAFDSAAALWETDIDLPADDNAWVEDDAGWVDEYTPKEWRLEEYAAQIVSATPVLRLNERAALSRRVRAILEEFPFPATAAALGRFVSNGASVDELEEACHLKCIWRDSPWMWLQRRYNRMQHAWRIEGKERQQRRGVTSSRTVAVRVAYDPGDVSRLNVWDPTRRQWITLLNWDRQYSSGLSWYAAKQIRDFARQRNMEFRSDSDKAKARIAHRDYLLDIMPEIKSVERARRARVIEPIKDLVPGDHVEIHKVDDADEITHDTAAKRANHSPTVPKGKVFGGKKGAAKAAETRKQKKKKAAEAKVQQPPSSPEQPQIIKPKPSKPVVDIAALKAKVTNRLNSKGDHP